MGKLKFLTPQQKQFWTDNGFIKLSGIFSENEMGEISWEYDDLFERQQKSYKEELEATWVGEDMKKLAGNINYTVSSDFSEICELNNLESFNLVMKFFCFKAS